MRKVLVIAAHMDDEVLGCGGTIAKHSGSGDRVCVIFVAHRVYKHKFSKKENDVQRAHALRSKAVLGYRDVFFLDFPDERLDAAVQDIIIPLEGYINKIRPQIVYLPFKSDNNQDHRAVFDATRVALRPLATTFIKYVNMYEVPSSTEQSPVLQQTAFLPNFYVDISKDITKKINAYKCYKTEMRRYPHPRSKEALIALAQRRGVEIGFDFAEAFMNIRGKW